MVFISTRWLVNVNLRIYAACSSPVLLRAQNQLQNNPFSLCFFFPNSTLHHDISQLVNDSCTPLPVPSLSHSSCIPPSVTPSYRGSRSHHDCTRSLLRVATPCCLLALCLLDDATVHLISNLGLACHNLSLSSDYNVFLCRKRQIRLH